jgi:hypothetical protein
LDLGVLEGEAFVAGVVRGGGLAVQEAGLGQQEGVPRPLLSPMVSRLSEVSSRRRRAVSTRTDVTKRAGVVPTSRVKTRAKLRGLIATLRARVSTDRSSLVCSRT